MKFSYEPVTAVELKTVVGPRPGAQTISNVIVFNMYDKGVRSAGIYNRRPIRGKKILTPATASLHAAGRGIDISVPNKQIGDELFLRVVNAADAIGVCEVIWWDKRATSKGILDYHGVDNHHTHLHIGITADMADNRSPQLDAWVKHFLFG